MPSSTKSFIPRWPPLPKAAPWTVCKSHLNSTSADHHAHWLRGHVAPLRDYNAGSDVAATMPRRQQDTAAAASVNLLLGRVYDMDASAQVVNAKLMAAQALSNVTVASSITSYDTMGGIGWDQHTWWVFLRT